MPGCWRVRMVWRVAITCPQQVVRVVLVEFGERHDKRKKQTETADQSWQVDG